MPQHTQRLCFNTKVHFWIPGLALLGRKSYDPTYTVWLFWKSTALVCVEVELLLQATSIVGFSQTYPRSCRIAVREISCWYSILAIFLLRRFMWSSHLRWRNWCRFLLSFSPTSSSLSTLPRIFHAYAYMIPGVLYIRSKQCIQEYNLDNWLRRWKFAFL